MTLKEIYFPDQLSRKDISERAENAGPSSRWSVLVQGDAEIGFLALDPHPDGDWLPLYEIFVPKEHRLKGLSALTAEKSE